MLNVTQQTGSTVSGEHACFLRWTRTLVRVEIFLHALSCLLQYLPGGFEVRGQSNRCWPTQGIRSAHLILNYSKNCNLTGQGRTWTANLSIPEVQSASNVWLHAPWVQNLCVVARTIRAKVRGCKHHVCKIFHTCTVAVLKRKNNHRASRTCLLYYHSKLAWTR